MRTHISKYLMGATLACTGLVAHAQGLEDIIVEEYHTVTQADADAYNNDFGGGSYPLVAGMKVYRIYVDMAPNYRLIQVYGDPIPLGQQISQNPLDITTTTFFWNDDNYGTEVPGQTRRFDEGLLFDSYLTVNTTGTSGGAAGCGQNTQQFGVLRSADTNGDLTTCGAYPGFTGNDGNIPGTGPTLTYNLGGTMDFSAFTGNGSSFQVVNEGWTTLPASQGVDPSGTNRVLIAQVTTNGDLSFHLNVDISDPNLNLERYVWNAVQDPGQQVSPKLTYPPTNTPDCLGVPGGNAIPGSPCDDGLATTGNDTWDANCNCVGQLIDCVGTPGGFALPGTPCNDNDPTTGNDLFDANCNCVGQPIDCLGVIGGNALPGTPCNDNDPTTVNDTFDAFCNCIGTPLPPDCLGVPGGSALPGTACDDNDPLTINDTWSANCACIGTPLTLDCEGTPGGNALPGTPCDDGLATTGNDTWDANCNCVGQLIDCLGVAGGSALPGTACDDSDPLTINDTWSANCACIGTPLTVDCEGTPGGNALPGTPCDDGSATTGNDTWDANCNCVGQLIDCLGVAGGSALPGTTCDDNDPVTINDTWSANCACVGTPLTADCEGTPGGNALPGTPCNDGLATTGNDTWDANCNCVGQLIDCLGVAGGSALPGTTCDDNDPSTTGDVYDANCVCAGTPLPADCLGVPGGSALPGTACDDNDPLTINDTWNGSCQCIGTPLTVDCEGNAGGAALPGTPCDDGDASTGNDTWDANCNCVGQLIDCLGVAGGSALPGTACNDGDPFTINDTWNASCNCVGTPVNCTEILTLTITPDAFGSETTWEVYDETGTILIANGGPYANGAAGQVITETICLNQLCYRLVVNDDGGNGIQNGGYILSDANGRRIINANGLFESSSSAIQPFCLPLSNQGLIAGSCDRTNLVYASSTQIYASTQPGASGYQFWIFDPHGSYNRRVLSTTPNLKPTTLATNPVPADLDLNVRVRALIGGNYTPFGRACIIRLNTPGGVSARGLEMVEESGMGLNLFPNPSRAEVVNLAVSGFGEMTAVQLEVIDLFGKRVHAEQFTVSGEGHIQTLDVKGLATGMYIVNLRASEVILTQRMVRH